MAVVDAHSSTTWLVLSITKGLLRKSKTEMARLSMVKIDV